MTICIAGICNGGKEERTVVASDRMVTERGTLQVEFEPDEPKMISPTENCLCLTAGSALRPSDVSFEIKEVDFSPSVNKIAKKVKEKVNKVSKRILKDEHLSPVGLDFDQLYAMGGSPLAGKIFDEIKQHKNSGVLNINLLIAGVDEEGAHIFLVSDPSEKACFDNIGFHAIGSGTDHARGSLLSNGFHTRELTLVEGAYLLYEAKKVAEIAPGVGDKYTDMWVVKEDEYKKINEEVINDFEEIREKKLESNKTALKNAFQDLEEKVDASSL